MMACFGSLPFTAVLGAEAPGVGISGLAQLSDVVVTGTRTEKARDEAPVRTEVVDHEEIQATGARTLKEALANISGLQLQELHGKSGYSLVMQGLGSDQVLVLIDGLPISASTGSTVDLSQYLLTDVLRVEVVKGAASAQYGSAAMGGVVNVITRRPTGGLRGDVQMGLGTRGRQNASGKRWTAAVRQWEASLQGGTDTLRGRLGLERISDEGFSPDPSGWTRQGDRVRRQQATGRLNWKPVGNTDLLAEFGRYEERDLQRFETFVPPNRVPQHKTEEIGRNRLVLGARHRTAQGSVVDLHGVNEHYDTHSQTHSNGVRTINRRSHQSMSQLGLQWDMPVGQTQSWQWGADLHRERLAQTQNGVSELQGNGQVHRTSHELFLQGDIFVTPAWEWVPGVRWQDDSDFGQHWAPKLAVRGRLYQQGDDTLTVRASIGQGYRVPNLKERHYLFDHSALGYRVVGNPDLKPESSTSFQLGAVLMLGPRWTVDVNAYLNRIRDLIQTDTDSARSDNGILLYTYDNVARARTQGLETAITWAPSAAWQLNAALTLGRTRDLATGREIAQRPRRMARLGMDWQAAAQTRVNLRLRSQGSELSDVTNNLRSSGWTVVDLNVRQQLARDLSVFLRADHLFDRQRNFSQSHQLGPISGRMVMLGLRYGAEMR